MRKLHIPIVDIVRPLSWGLAGLLILFVVMTFRLQKLHSGISRQEVATVQAALSYSATV